MDRARGTDTHMVGRSFGQQVGASLLITRFLLTYCRIVSIGSQGYVINSQEPKNDFPLPVNDIAWVSSQI